eukprot:752840-Rhodomonas_salina.2
MAAPRYLVPDGNRQQQPPAAESPGLSAYAMSSTAFAPAYSAMPYADLAQRMGLRVDFFVCFFFASCARH